MAPTLGQFLQAGAESRKPIFMSRNGKRMVLFRRGADKQFSHMVRQNFPAPFFFSKRIGHQPPRDAAHPCPEVFITPEFRELFERDNERVLRKIVHRLPPHAERANESTQP